MKQKRIIISLVGIFILSTFLIMLIFSKSNNKSFVQNGVLFAVTLDGISVSSFPDYSSGDYTVVIDCENAKGQWKQVYNENNSQYDWKLTIDEISGKVTCNLDFKTKTDNDTLINVVSSVKEQTSINNGICSDLKYKTMNTCEDAGAIWWGVFDENGLRFEGFNPNNYVWFNDELWRIIGYLPTKDAAGTDTNLIKIIRNNTIGSLMYSKDDEAYDVSYIYNLLNKNYYYKIDGTNSSYCNVDASKTSTCDYRINGINEIFRNMIEPVQWPTGIQTSGDVVIKQHYASEVNSYTNVTGGIHVGLMSASDFAYSYILSASVREKTTLRDRISTNISWLATQGFERTLSAGDNTTWIINDFGFMSNANITYAYAIRPVVYLDPSVYVVSGAGTASNPYILNM